jgi:hypothetical protein
MDASESGGDVFFMTTSKLSPLDAESSYAVYDAHECTSESPCLPQPAGPSPECVTAEACRAAPLPEPSIYGPPSSATFNGLGNLTPSPSSSSGSKPPACSSSLGAPEKKCTKKQNLTKAIATCKRKYPRNKKKRAGCEATARHKYSPKPKAARGKKQ